MLNLITPKSGEHLISPNMKVMWMKEMMQTPVRLITLVSTVGIVFENFILILGCPVNF